MITKNLEVTIEDLKRIGFEYINSSGNLAIMCDSDSHNIEYILLRNILEITGNKIINEKPEKVIDCDGEEIKGYVFYTDFKWVNFINIEMYIKNIIRSDKIENLLS